MKVYVIVLALAMVGSYVECSVFTDQNCNYKLWEKMGCEDDQHTECVKGRCQCKEEFPVVLRGRFCVQKTCAQGQYYEHHKAVCVAQSLATPNSKGSHCRYDYQCKGSHVRCKIQGYNRNCVCDPGFVFEEIAGECKPKYGIGGHCKTELDCDQSDLRKMHCEFDKDNEGSGTCQCVTGHQYNYHIDGCESIEAINQRGWQVRGLLILMVMTGIIFGLALTCNMGLLGRAAVPNEIFLKRIIEERQRREAEAKKKLESDTEANVNLTSTPKNLQSQASGVVSSAPPDDAIIAIDDHKPLEEVNGKKTVNGLKLMQF